MHNTKRYTTETFKEKVNGLVGEEYEILGDYKKLFEK